MRVYIPAKAWKAKHRMDALQDEHNATTDQVKRAELRKRIEAELQYPSTIKITVIRESRFTETAT